jgi:magnesium chelatase family protein
MLARRLTTMFPAMTLAEAIETTRIRCVTGRTAFVTTRPFRAPHHTISDAGLIGGGAGADAGRHVAVAPWYSMDVQVTSQGGQT